MIYYNFTVGVLSLCVIPYIRKKKVSLVLKGMDLQLSFYSAVSLAKLRLKPTSGGAAAC
jgi:hypothetical protein